MLSAKPVYAHNTHICRAILERIHGYKCMYICLHIQQRLIQYIRLMSAPPFKTYKSYRIKVIASININAYLVNRITMCSYKKAESIGMCSDRFL